MSLKWVIGSVGGGRQKFANRGSKPTATKCRWLQAGKGIAPHLGISEAALLTLCRLELHSSETLK